MKIEEQTINLENIEEILKRELNDLNQNRETTDLFIYIRKRLYDIFNTWNNDKEAEIKELKENIDNIGEFLVEILYGKHDLE